MENNEFDKMARKGIVKQLAYLAIGSFGATWLLNKAFKAGSEYTAGSIGSELSKLGLRSSDKESK